MILILSNPEDAHARHIANRLRQSGKSVVCFPRSDFGNGASVSFYPELCQGTITLRDGTKISSSDVSAVWYRRPGPVEINPSITDELDRSFASNEWGETLDALFMSAARHVVNPPFRQRAATKPLQLAAARRAGLPVPETLITNAEKEALAFASRHNSAVIHKAISAPVHRFVDTRLWDDEAVRHLADLPLCPTILQERVIGPVDIRVTVVGKQLFCARIETARGRAEIDSRLDPDAPCLPCEIPSDVEAAIHRLMDDLGLVFGAIDLKLTDTGEHVFLEVNPQGQFLYIELRTGLPISDALTEFLALP
jgi:glutathione synthase/RimK-type ligase-like ATP-grasp enzyme